MRARNLSTLLVAGGLALGVAAAPVAAHPKDAETFPLVCDDGNTYIVTTNGNGEFTPAHDTDSNTVFVPLSFGDFHGTVTDSEGNVEEFTEPGVAKGQSGKNAKNTVTCTFSFSGTEDGMTFEASGSVTGYATPGGRP